MKTTTYRKIVRVSAIYDILATFPFAIPWLAVWNLGLIRDLHNSYGFSGTVSDFEPFNLFFVNLMGSLVMVWSALRVYRPEPLFGLYDSFARVLFSTWMLYYLLVHKVTGVIWLFVGPEISWGIIQIYGYVAQRNDPENARAN